MISGIEEMRRRLEVLLGAKPEAPVDETKKEAAETSARSNHQQRVAAAGGEMLGAVFNFLGELIQEADDTNQPSPPPEIVNRLRENLAGCAVEDEAGRQRLTVTLPSREALDNLAKTLARLMVGQAEA
jgi:hypothetical protein